jgi:hypothetical protein
MEAIETVWLQTVEFGEALPQVEQMFQPQVVQAVQPM